MAIKKKINSLDELLISELMDLYSAEKQIVKALPKMVKAAESQELESALNEHLEVTKGQVNRLEQIFEELNQRPKQKMCKGMEGIIKENEEVVKETDKGMARDAGIIGGAQRVEHYEITGYGTAKAHAEFLGQHRVAQLLEETLNQEKDADQKLNSIAETFVNQQALQGQKT